MGREGESQSTERLSLPVGRRRGPWVVGLRISLVVYSLLTVLLTAAVVHLPWLYTSRENVANLADQINDEILKGLSSEVDDIFRSAA